MSVYLGENKVGVGMYEKVLPREKSRYVLDANGNATPVSGALDLSDIVSVGTKVLQYGFYDCPNITSVDLSSLTSVGSNGMYQCFKNCSNLRSIDMSSLTSVGGDGLRGCFQYCFNLRSIDMSSLTSVGDYGLYQSFSSCTNLASVDLSSLTSVGNNGLYQCFQSCSNLEVVHFDECPSVVPITSNTFSSAGTNVTGGYKVVVPDALYDDWCAARYWSDIADHIVKVSEYVPTPNDPFAN